MSIFYLGFIFGNIYVPVREILSFYCISDLKAIKNETENCICGSISISHFIRGTVIKAKVQAFNLPGDTEVEVQLIRNDRIAEIINITGQKLKV